MPARSWLGFFILRFQLLEATTSWSDALSHGSFRGFPSYEDANRMLDGWVTQHPKLLRKEQIGTSFERRPIHAYILTTEPGQPKSRPQMLITALMHSREPASLTVVLYFIGHLLELYAAGDPEAIYVVEHRELWLVPFVNPDGYIANERTPGAMIRKNRRPTCRRSQDSGVDINRNFAIAWKAGTFPRCNEEYQGETPFSEPETQAIKHVCDKNQFKAAINFHSFGSMLTHPYNHAATLRTARLPKEDDNTVYDEIQKVFKFDKFGPAIKTVGYTAPGESDDWLYGAKGIISMSPEVGPESGNFFPPRDAIAGIDSRNFKRNQYLAQKVGLELGVSWRYFPSQSREIPASVWSKFKDGSSPSSVLQLRLRNSGLSASSGDSLRVAVAGVIDAESAMNSQVTVLSSAGENLGAQLNHSTTLATITFQLPPLQRRSTLEIYVVLQGTSSQGAKSARTLQLCGLETTMAASSGSQVCQCLGPTEVRVPQLRAEAFVEAQSKTYALGSGMGRVDWSRDALCVSAANAEIEHRTPLTGTGSVIAVQPVGPLVTSPPAVSAASVSSPTISAISQASSVVPVGQSIGGDFGLSSSSAEALPSSLEGEDGIEDLDGEDSFGNPWWWLTGLVIVVISVLLLCLLAFSTIRRDLEDVICRTSLGRITRVAPTSASDEERVPTLRSPGARDKQHSTEPRALGKGGDRM